MRKLWVCLGVCVVAFNVSLRKKMPDLITSSVRS